MNATKSRQRVKPVRSIRLVAEPTATMAGVLTIKVDWVEVSYLLRPLAADFGAGFELEKIGGTEVYHVNLDGPSSTCDCKGFLRWGRCKHRDGIAALRQAGKV